MAPGKPTIRLKFFVKFLVQAADGLTGKTSGMAVRTRRNWGAVWGLAALACGGCAARASQITERRPGCGPESRPGAQLQAVRGQAEAWLTFVEYRPGPSYDAGPSRPTRQLRPVDGHRHLALLSYPGAPSSDPTSTRSYVYDDALGLLWLTVTGDEERARGLARTLVAIQNEDGTWGFSFGLDGFYNAAYVRMGAVAWAAHALAIFAQRYPDPPAAAAAEKAAQAMLAARRQGAPAAPGLIEGGRGRWSPDQKQFLPDFRFRAAVTEHQLDAHMALVALKSVEADQLARQMLSTLWIEPEGRLAAAADNAGPDGSRVLDAAGGWGALWLESIGERARAKRSLEYSLRTFPATDGRYRGYRPYLDPVDGPTSAMDPDLIFVEGTLGVGLAALRLGDRATAEAVMSLAVQLGCDMGPGIPYANKNATNFPATPAAAPTLWFLFLEREMRTGERAPIWAGAPR